MPASTGTSISITFGYKRLRRGWKTRLSSARSRVRTILLTLKPSTSTSGYQRYLNATNHWIVEGRADTSLHMSTDAVDGYMATLYNGGDTVWANVAAKPCSACPQQCSKAKGVKDILVAKPCAACPPEYSMATKSSPRVRFAEGSTPDRIEAKFGSRPQGLSGGSVQEGATGYTGQLRRSVRVHSTLPG